MTEHARLLAIVADRPDWMDDANCRGVDPDLFYPVPGESTRQACEVCARCDVRRECLAYALSHREKHGIWGGKSERDRRRLRRWYGLGADVTTTKETQQHDRTAHRDHRDGADPRRDPPVPRHGRDRGGGLPGRRRQREHRPRHRSDVAVEAAAASTVPSAVGQAEGHPEEQAASSKDGRREASGHAGGLPGLRAHLRVGSGVGEAPPVGASRAGPAGGGAPVVNAESETEERDG